MDWTMLGAVGELIGALAVVLSLLYVGRQVRHNTTMARSTVRHELTSEMNAWALAVASEPSLAASFAKVHDGMTRDEATPVERMQIAYAFVGFVGQMQLAFRETADGVLHPQELAEMYGPGSNLLTQPYLKTLWPYLRAAYSKDFVEWFEVRYDLVDEERSQLRNSVS